MAILQKAVIVAWLGPVQAKARSGLRFRRDGMASSNANRLTRDEYRKKAAEDELRKAGTLPAELDEHGKEINPHIPQFIAAAPW